jgi:hypothetical protein
VDVDGTSAVADIEYFFRLQFGDSFYSLALGSVFSPPDLDLLNLSEGAAYICHHGGIDALVVVDVKAINALVAMVPDYQVNLEGEIIIPEGRFSLVDAPFLKSASFWQAGDDDDDGIPGNSNDASQ